MSMKRVLLDGRVELDRALEDAELDLELARGLLRDEELGDVEVCIGKFDVIQSFASCYTFVMTCDVLDAEIGVQIYAAFRMLFSPLIMPGGS